MPRYTAFALEKNSHIITMAVLSLILASILLATTTLATPIVDVSFYYLLIACLICYWCLDMSKKFLAYLEVCLLIILNKKKRNAKFWEIPN